MIRSTAVQRLNDAVGFRMSGHDKEATFILRLQEAQRDLELGKTLPKFLIQEDQTLFLAAGEHFVNIPSGFIREDDDNRIHYTSPDTNMPLYLTPMRYSRAVRAVTTQQRPDQPALQTIAPAVYVIRKSTIDFITKADVDYTLVWNYYKAGALLTSDIENEWLAYAPEWLIGEAGERIARNLRDQDALADFQEMKQKGSRRGLWRYSG